MLIHWRGCNPSNCTCLCGNADRMQDLQDCLEFAAHAAEWAGSVGLATLCHTLARAEELIKEQPLPPQQGRAPVEKMRWLQTLLRQAGPIIDTWDESEVCLRATTQCDQ